LQFCPIGETGSCALGIWMALWTKGHRFPVPTPAWSGSGSTGSFQQVSGQWPPRGSTESV